METPAETVKTLIERADRFIKNHPSEKALGPTYGYFTRHPVAPLNRKRLRMMLERLDRYRDALKRPLRVLDLACGGGLITCAIAARGHRVLGLDLSVDEIRLARLFAQKESLNGMFLQTDLLQNPNWEKMVEETLGGPPDVITLAYALHHLPGVEGFVERVSKWLPNGAVLLINEENPESPVFRLKHRVRTWIQKDTETEWHRTFAGWKEILEARGFRVDAVPQGADLLPWIGPLKSWSLVFSAERA